MADDRIIIEIDIDDGKIKKGFAKVEKQSKKTSKTIEKNLKTGFASKAVGKALGSLKGQILSLGVAFAGVFAVRGLANFASEVIAASQQQEEAINNLNTALKSAGQFSQSTSDDIQNFAAFPWVVTCSQNAA